MIRKLVPIVLVTLLVWSGAAASQGSNSYTLQTVLLVGSTEGKSDLTAVPENVVEALGDVLQLLPYKSCRLIDASVLRSNGEGRGLLKGPDGKRDFELRFDFHERDAGELRFRVFNLDTLVAEPRNRTITGEDGKTRIERDPPAWVRRTVIGTSFTVKVGETIVVGTSKLNGNGEALIVLFTAMP